MVRVLVTGAAGFIGFHLSKFLVAQGNDVIGLDNLNNYYDVSLKQARLVQLTDRSNFQFYKLDLADRNGMMNLFSEHRFDIVVNLAAQAGVRHSLDHPHDYVNSNLIGFLNVLEGCRHSQIQHLVFASSSSVYGANTKVPFAVHDPVDQPINFYAATKKSNELMAYSYSHLYGIPTTGLRFFTVYGPWGRPDMAMFLFTQAIVDRKPINLFNYGMMQRDFTYIDDIVEGIVRVIVAPPLSLSRSGAEVDAEHQPPYRLYNIGNHQPIRLLYLVELLEKCLGIKAIKNLLPLQPGEVPITYADVEDLVRDFGFKPSTSIETGIEQFVEWYFSYFKLHDSTNLELV